MQDAKRARMQDVETIRHGVTLVSGWEDKPLVELLEAAKRLPVKQIRLHVQVPLPHAAQASKMTGTWQLTQLVIRSRHQKAQYAPPPMSVG